MRIVRVSPFDLVCGRCGQRISWSRRHLRYVHAARGPVAACDLDTDHTAEPDWPALGKVACAVCDSPVEYSGEEFFHTDRQRDADHRADPGFQGLPGWPNPPQ